MFDAVVNHVSASHPWFRSFLAGEEPFVDWFPTEDPSTDLSAVVRPRATPLLTPFETAHGTRHVWTTFSADQIDLDYANPDVLLAVVRVLLEYVRRGAEILRLDAVTFLWKEVGTSCVHHPNTHRILKLMRAAMEAVAPRVVLLTETNVPHLENVGYFGSGFDEAQMVYNFALPPLVLHAFHTGDATRLQQWARGLGTPSDETTFFNFLASHDGIGVRPVEQILPKADVTALVERVRGHGGLVSMKRNSDGSESPYELNISYFDALSDPASDEGLERQVARFMTAQAIMLALAGVPGIYVHSLLGSRSAHAEVERTGRARSVNRAKFDLAELERELGDPSSIRTRVLDAFRALLRARRSRPEFSPQAAQEVLDTPVAVFGVRRGDDVYCFHNLSDAPVTVHPSVLPARARDLATGAEVPTAGGLQLAPAMHSWIVRA
jgi:sucrose phosphorylase